KAGATPPPERPNLLSHQTGSHTADRAGSPIGPAAPVERVIDGVIVHVGGGSALEKVPCEATRNRVVATKRRGQARVDVAATPFKRFGAGLQRLRTRDTLRPKTERAIRPDVDFTNVADRAGPEVFDGGASLIRGVPLVAHLRDDLGFFRAPGELACFFN